MILIISALLINIKNFDPGQLSFANIAEEFLEDVDEIFQAIVLTTTWVNPILFRRESCRYEHTNRHITEVDQVVPR